MVNQEKLKRAVVQSLNLASEVYTPDLKLGDIPQWDSLGHLTLIFAIEDEFNIQFNSERIPMLKSLALISEEIESLTQQR